MKVIQYFIMIIVLLLPISSCEKNSSIDESIVIDFWDIAVPGDNKRQEIQKEVLQKIEKEFPHLVIKLTTMDGDSYKTAINTVIKAGEQPDIFYTWLPAYSESFVKSGSVLKIDTLLSTHTKESVNMDAIMSGNSMFDGIYALPIEVKLGVLYCNSKLFKKYNIPLPENYNDLLEVIDQFNMNGISPLLAPGRRLWPIMWLYDIISIKKLGSREVISTLSGYKNFNNGGYLESAIQFTELIDRNAFLSNSLLMDNNEANRRFLDGEVPMYFMGSWFSIEITDSPNRISNDIVAIDFPSFDNDYDNHVLGGTGDGYMISSKTPNKDLTVQVLERYIELMGESEAVLFPIWNTEKDFSTMPDLYSSINKIFKKTDGYVIWWDTYLTPQDAQKHKELTIELFSGVLDAEEFYKKMQLIGN